MPKDINMAHICDKSREPRHGHESFTQFNIAEIRNGPIEYVKERTGYMIHAHCWALLECILGPEFKQTKLDVFIQAAKKHWSHDASSRIDELDAMWGGRYDPVEWYSRRCNIYLSPLVIPEVQNAIERAKNINNRSMIPHLTNLPLEISVMIMEYVCPIHYTKWDVKNTRSILSAFQWVLPNSFWELRFRNHERLLFELRSLKDMNSVNWQSLWLDMMALLCDSDRFMTSGLATRERVLRSIEDILRMCE